MQSKPRSEESSAGDRSIAQSEPAPQSAVPTPPPERVIPKFSSFKPAVALKPTVQPAPPSQEDSAIKHRHRHDRIRSPDHEKRRNRGRDDRLKEKGHTHEHGRDRDHDYERTSGKRETKLHRHSLHDSGRTGREKRREGSRLEGDKNYSSHTRHRDRRSHSPKRLKEATEPAAVPDPIILPWDTSDTPAFSIDTKGDPANLVYGTIHRYSIPQYRRSGHGRILGLRTDLRIVEDKGDGKGLVLSHTRREDGEHQRPDTGGRQYRFAIAEGDGLRRLKVIKEDRGTGSKGREFEYGLEFVPLSSRKSKPESEQQPYHFSLTSGPTPDNRPHDEDLELASASDSEVDEMANWNAARNRGKHQELQRKIAANPNNVDAWLELVSHQDSLLRSSATGRKQRVTLAEQQSTAEIKLSILEKALGGLDGTDKQALERLWVCWFDVAAEILDSNKLLIQYQSVLQQYPAMHAIWVKYLNFRQTDFESFNYRALVGCYTHCLELLRESIMRQRNVNSQLEIEQLEKTALYVIFRGLRMMREAGFSEISIATLQGLLEINFCAPTDSIDSWPPTSSMQFRKCLDYLEEFWESEVPRIGEVSAKGWKEFFQGGNHNIAVPAAERTSTRQGGKHDIDPMDPFGSWAQNEEEAERDVWPARVVDQVENEDPFSVALFGDISPWLFIFGHSDTLQGLVDHTLMFCDLPHGSQFLTSERPVSISPLYPDTFLIGNSISNAEWFWPPNPTTADRLLSWEGMEPERGGGLKKDAFGFKFDSGYPITVDMLFGRDTGEWVFPMACLNSHPKAALVTVARRLLQLLVRTDYFQNDIGQKYAVLFLALEWRADPQASMKLAKSLLKKYRNSLLLWAAYAQMEWRSGNVHAARNVFQTALTMSRSFPHEKRSDAISLCLAWTWEELMDNDPWKALQALASFSGDMTKRDGIVVDGELQKTALLRIKRQFIDEQNRLLSLGSSFYASLHNQAQALVEYLSTFNPTTKASLQVTPALPVYDNFLSELSERGQSSSTIFTCSLINGKIRLLYHHSRTSRSFQPSLLREALEMGIASTPDGSTSNTLFWSLYAWNEGRFAIDGRIRGWLRAKLNSSQGYATSVPACAFCIWAEARMAGGYVHSIRAMFEDALESAVGRGSVALWRLWVEFELREGEPKRARLVWFKAIRSVPWSKEIAMLAFTKLLNVLEFPELKKAFAIVALEKELRTVNGLGMEEALDAFNEEDGRRIYPGLGDRKGNVVDIEL